ncbi:MAG: hypothetical protein U1D55_13345 [Phycisphaerae bacterium]
MFRNTSVRGFARLAALTLLATCGTAFAGNVDLLFGPAAPLKKHVTVGNIVTYKLIMRSTDATPRSVSALEAILSWNPGQLQLIGSTQVGAGYSFFVTGFLPDPDGINTTFADGNALFTALAQPGSPAVAPISSSAGLVVTTFQFQALTVNCDARVQFLASSGTFGRTRVFDGAIANLEVTGSISSQASAAICNSCIADLDCDCDVDESDLGILLAGWQFDSRGDLDADGDTDESDLGILLGDWHCGVP